MKQFPETFGVMSSTERRISKGILEGRPWAMDNCAFTTGFNPDKFFSKLQRYEPFRENCLFIVLPDVVGNAEATHSLFLEWFCEFERTGFPIAYCLQDGQEDVPIPREVDCLFIGGTDKFKLSKTARNIALNGKSVGKWIHVGRVNSLKRVLRFDGIADSVDGNCLKFGPDINGPKITEWMETVNGFRAKQSHMARPVLPGQHSPGKLACNSIRSDPLGSVCVPGWSRGDRTDLLREGSCADPLGQVGVLDLDAFCWHDNGTG
jgi:hypothetical protein